MNINSPVTSKNANKVGSFPAVGLAVDQLVEWVIVEHRDNIIYYNHFQNAFQDQKAP